MVAEKGAREETRAPISLAVVLDTVSPAQSITLAGDTQQHLVEHGGFRSWSEFLQQLGLASAS